MIYLCGFSRLSLLPAGDLPFLNNVTVKPVLDTHFMARLKDQGLFKSVGDEEFVDEFDALPIDGFSTLTDVHDFMARSSEALILTDGQGKISAINKPWFDMCGFTADEVHGKTHLSLFDLNSI